MRHFIFLKNYLRFLVANNCKKVSFSMLKKVRSSALKVRSSMSGNSSISNQNFRCSLSYVTKLYFNKYIIPHNELTMLQKSCCVLISFLFQSVKTEKEYKKDCFSKKPLRISLVDIFI